jgi:hypothetical protein
MVFSITNNEAVPIVVCYTRLPIPTLAGTAFIQTSPITSYVPIQGFYGDVSPTDTITIDSVRYPRVKSVKWLITITEPVAQLTKSLEVYAVFKNGAYYAHTYFGILGDVLNVNVNVTQTGIIANLVITNNELQDIIINVTRIPITMESSAICIPKISNIDGDILYLTPINDVNIAPAATTSVDFPSFMDHQAVKWLVAITNPTTSKTMGVQVYATHRMGVLPVHTNYTITGDFLPVVSNVVISGSDLTLQLTNNDVSAVIVDVIRIPVSI